jgi:hypothetical protein
VATKRKPKPPAHVDGLAPDPDNPRRISPEARAALARSMASFGDLSGIVFNVRTGRLVAGHQRRGELPDDADIVLDEDAEDSTGTVGYGHAEALGTRWPVRFVDWPEPKERAANIAANSPLLAGEFTEDLDELIAGLKADLPDLTEDLRLDDLVPDAAEIQDAVEPFDVQRPIERVWVLVGIPADQYADHAKALETLGKGEGIIFDSTIR